ncbi:MAG TPA: GNAT family N-acetyltransferase [Ktedonobacteraceae bacterium]|nr:GNAT family N-acetyltransferase [Ktedonobacteraceae bacterium]
MTQPAEADAQPQGAFWMMDLDQPLPVGLVTRLPVAFMRIGPEVAQELAHAMQLDDPSVVLQRFARGCHCYAGRIDGKLATYGWVTYNEEGIGELGLNFRLKAAEAYIWDCATLPAYRGLRLYPALLAYILGELQSLSMHRAWIGADTDNLASQSGLALVGFQPVVDVFITHVSTLPRFWIRGRPGVPEQLVTDVRHALHPK